MALRWFKKKKRTAAPEDLAQQEPAAEQIEAEVTISEPSTKGSLFGLGKKKPDPPRKSRSKKSKHPRPNCQKSPGSQTKQNVSTRKR